MDDHAKLERLLADGYLLVGDVIHLSKLTPESAAKAASFFKLDPEIFLDPSNKTKSLVMLRHRSSGQQVEILTSEERTIKRANEQLRYQREPIGTLIHVSCIALRGGPRHLRIHVDRLVASLNGLWGWDFKLGDIVGTFEVLIRLKSTDRGAIEETIGKLQRLLDCLAISQQVGFYIQRYSSAPIPRCGPTVYTSGVEMMLPSVSPEEIGSIEATLSFPKATVAARNLNLAYIENCAPSRLSMLWAAAEEVFGGEAKPLLNEEEAKYLIDYATREIESLRNDPDRLKKLKDALANSDRLPLITRNERMADAIAPIMGINVEDAYREVRTASKLRGKHGHQVSANWKNIEAPEKFLQEALLCYLRKQKTS